MKLNIAINGFGRIGKTFLRTIMQEPIARESINIVAINLGPSSPEHLETFFTYDSTYGKFASEVRYTNNTLSIDGHNIKIFSELSPEKLPWNELKIDWVIEASGKFVDKADLHRKAGCKKVLITAPAKNEDITIIPGVNDHLYDAKKHHIVSLGSCTTNCFAPIIKVLRENFHLVQGLMTTVHAYTNDQVLLDGEHKDPRRGRSAAINIVPTSTGADKVITKIYPDLEGKLQGIALRVPVAVSSLIDFTFTTNENLSKEGINKAFEKAAGNNLKGILAYSTEELVSTDFIGSPYSCTIDAPLTKTTGNMGKVFGWYDNEFGYSSRLKDFLLHKG